MFTPKPPPMKTNTTAVILTGMQNECFLPEGRLRPMFEGQVRTRNMLANTLAMLEAAAETELELLLVPTLFQPGYPELVEPVGVLAGIRDAGAFQQGDPGSEVLEEIRSMGDRIRILAGKHTMNAFTDTGLEEALRERGIDTVVLAGLSTSVCVDSTARMAYEKGFRVKILTDCIAGRTPIEDEIYCAEIFPMYAELLTSSELLESVGAAAPAA